MATGSMGHQAKLLCALVLAACALAHGAPLEHSDAGKRDRITSLPGAPKESFDKESMYGGYVTVDDDAGRAFYYLLAEAREQPDDAPLILWLNGGPGCSSVGGGFMAELGPFFPDPGQAGLVPNPYSWTRVANVLFLETPAFVGFSYSNSTDDHTVGDERVALDNFEFMNRFLERFPRFVGRPFWIAGESYAGHYVPQLAMKIFESDAFESGRINLQGMLVGNPWTDAVADNLGQALFLVQQFLTTEEAMDNVVSYCSISSVWPLDKRVHDRKSKNDADADTDAERGSTHGALQAALDSYRRGEDVPPLAMGPTLWSSERALDWAAHNPEIATQTPDPDTLTQTLDPANSDDVPHSTEDPDLGPTDDTECKAAMLEVLHQVGAVSLYDIYQDVCVKKKQADAMARLPSLLQALAQSVANAMSGEGDFKPHGPQRNACISKDLTRYLNRPEVQEALHANTTGLDFPWAECTNRLHYSGRDAARSMVPLYRKLIHQGLQIVIYSGTVDAAVPTTGTELWLQRMHLHVEQPFRAWTMPSGQQGGHILNFEGGLSFITVRGAGHMVPYTEPARALHMLESILQGKPLA